MRLEFWFVFIHEIHGIRLPTMSDTYLFYSQKPILITSFHAVECLLLFWIFEILRKHSQKTYHMLCVLLKPPFSMNDITCCCSFAELCISKLHTSCQIVEIQCHHIWNMLCNVKISSTLWILHFCYRQTKTRKTQPKLIYNLFTVYEAKIAIEWMSWLPT